MLEQMVEMQDSYNQSICSFNEDKHDSLSDMSAMIEVEELVVDKACEVASNQEKDAEKELKKARDTRARMKNRLQNRKWDGRPSCIKCWFWLHASMSIESEI